MNEVNIRKHITSRDEEITELVYNTQCIQNIYVHYKSEKSKIQEIAAVIQMYHIS
jgi:hypothetical protein